MNISALNRILSIAPMMDWTDRHCRYFLRLISRHTLLYTEMITTGAILYGNCEKLLHYHPAEHPIALQLGGSNPKDLAQCANIAEDYGYNEVNLNVGCPSDRVQSGQFGLCLMENPELVADCVRAMKKAVKIPVTVKTRTGVDHHDSDAELHHFIQCQSDAGVDHVTIHARKGWLQGLSPKENRHIPPLEYDKVYRVKQAFPLLNIGINGGIEILDQATEHLQHVDAVMLGRAAYHNPYILAEADQRFFNNDHAIPSRQEIVERLIPYIEKELVNGVYLKHITRHILGLFQGQPGARRWRRYLSENAHLPGADVNAVKAALLQLD